MKILNNNSWRLRTTSSKGGRSEKGIITETSTRFQSSLPWLNLNNLNFFIRKQCAAMNILSMTVAMRPSSDTVPMEAIVIDGESSIYDLSCPQIRTKNSNLVFPSNFGTSANTTTPESDDVTIATDAFASSTDGSSSSWRRGGRPKGSTNEFKHHTQRELVNAKNYCAMAFLHLKKQRRRETKG
jgi:hypothetical protein